MFYNNYTWRITFKHFESLFGKGISVGTALKNLPAMQQTVCNAGDVGRFPREGNGNPCQYSCLRHAMDRGTWGAI